MAHKPPRPVVRQILIAASLLLAGCNQRLPESDFAGCDHVPMIALTGRVTDAAALLADKDKAALEDRLGTYEQRSGHQMAVATVPTLGGVDVATFGSCTANRWAIGKKTVNDGVIILVAPKERQFRIVTGTGMEKMLTDGEAQTVAGQMASFFKRGDYAGGLTVAIDAIATETGGGQ